MERLEAAAQSVNIGPVEFPQNFMGAVIEPAARDKVLSYIEIGKKAGYPLFERKIQLDNGYFVPLCIFTDVDPESRLAQEEIFGPVLAVIKVRDFDEALRVANGTQYALTGGVLSRSPANIRKARESFRTGNLYINRGCTGAIVGRHPFGGFKMSGLGSKAGGPGLPSALHDFAKHSGKYCSQRIRPAGAGVRMTVRTSVLCGMVQV